MRKSNKGFTMIEILVAMSIISILCLMAGPNMIPMVKQRQISAAAQELLNVVKAARITAIRNNSFAVLSLDQTSEQYEVFLENDPSRPNFIKDIGEKTVKAGRFVNGVDLYSTNLIYNVIGFDEKGFPKVPSTTPPTTNLPTFLAATANIYLKHNIGGYKGIQITIAGGSAIVRSADGKIWVQ